MLDSTRILIVEDSPTDQELAKEYLEESGFSSSLLFVANRLSEAKAFLQDNACDIALLDLSLPDSFGLEGLSKVRLGSPGLPVIILTGNNDRLIALDAIKNGAQDYLVKGNYTADQLERSIRYALERKRSEQRILEKEAQYRALVENMNESILVTDSDGIIQFVNPQCEQLSGYSKNELIGKAGHFILNKDNNQGDFIPAVQNPLNRNSYELQMIKRNGDLRWVSISSSPIFNHFEIFLGTIFVVSDISDKKESEIRRMITDRAFSSAAEGIVITDALKENNPIIYVNNAFLETTGFTNDEIIGKGHHFLLGKEFNLAAARSIQLAYESGVEFQGEMISYKKNGTPYWSELTITPVVDGNGTILNFISFQRDISKKKEALIREKVVYAIARKANDSQPSIFSLSQMMQHQLNQVLDASNMYLSLLEIQNDEKILTFPYFQDERVSRAISSSKKNKAVENIKASSQSRLYILRKFGKGLTEHVIRTKRPLLISGDDLRLKKKLSGLGGDVPMCWLGVPLISKGKVIGALVVKSYCSETAYNESDMDFLMYVAGQLQGLIERIRTHLALMESQTALKKEHKKGLKFQSMLLSTQLNPHFIFNSLNSIQYHILNQNQEPALVFLTDFAKLMRTVMHNSANELITLNDEIEFLKMYLELEKNRHRNKFQYEIRAEDDFDTEDILIPPMLLQPFVENTVIHGIGNLSADGRIDILFHRKKKNMTCVITDNGVGRTEAERLKALKSNDQISFSTAVISRRLKILNAIGGHSYSSKTEDLLAKDGRPSGTRVIVEFPLMQETKEKLN